MSEMSLSCLSLLQLLLPIAVYSTSASEDVQCTIPSIMNGRTWLSNENKIVFSCNPGYDLEGNCTATCLCSSEGSGNHREDNICGEPMRYVALGRWSATIPQCIKTSQPTPETSESLSVMSTQSSSLFSSLPISPSPTASLLLLQSSTTLSPSLSPTPTPCTKRDIHLVHGNDTSGLVEVCYEGKWKSVCDDYWNDADANVACRQLGVLDFGAKTIREGKFNKTEPIEYWLDDMRCRGHENSLFDCDHKMTGIHNCAQGERAGVECLNTSDIDIRLATDGIDNNSGAIEISIRGEWRSICDNHWSDLDAEVACRQLGYSNSDARVSGPYEGGDKYWLDFVRCEGHEMSLLACSHIHGNSITCENGQRAGVQCEEIYDVLSAI